MVAAPPVSPLPRCRAIAARGRSQFTMKLKFPLVPLTLSIAAVIATPRADVPRVLAPGTLPDDIRLQPPKDLNGYFPFTPPTSKAIWEERAAYVRRQILVSQGLWPMPTKTPLNAVIHGRIERD